MIPKTHYADSGGAEIAYRVVGTGPRDIVLAMPGPTHLDMLWEMPDYADFVDRLSHLGRVLAFDKRGQGLSTRDVDGLSAEQRSRDIMAVMDAAGSSAAVLFGWMDSAAIGLLTAALFPERVSAVIAGEALALGHRDAEHPFGVKRKTMKLIIKAIEHGAWGRSQLGRVLNPRVKLTPAERAAYARFESMAATPKAAAQLFQMHMDLDLRPRLADIRAPVLLLHDERFHMVPADGVQWLADRLPDARLRFIGGAERRGPGIPLEEINEEIEEFLSGTRGALANRQVMTLLFTDVVGSTSAAVSSGDTSWKYLLSAHRDAVRKALARFGGVEIDTAGDGFLTSFTLPSSALRCAAHIVADARQMGFEVRAGVHTGEVMLLTQGGLVGIAVHIAARVAALAGPSEVLLTDTVRTLVEGSGISLEPAGERALKGVPGMWALSRVAHHPDSDSEGSQRG